MDIREAIEKIRKTHCNENLRCTDNCMRGEQYCEYAMAISALEKQESKKEEN